MLCYPVLVMLRGRYSCARSILPTPSSIPLSPYCSRYRSRPSLNCPVLLGFSARTDSRTDSSSIYPLSPLVIPSHTEKTRGGVSPSAPALPSSRRAFSPLSPFFPPLTQSLSVSSFPATLTGNGGRGWGCYC